MEGGWTLVVEGEKMFASPRGLWPIVPAASSWLELFEEAQVVFEEQADVVDAVFQHGDTFDAESKREPGPFFCIVINEFEYCRVDHACPKNFYPTCLRTNPAPFSATNHALNIDFRAGAGEGKEAGTEPDFCIFAKHFLEKNTHDAFEMTEGNIFIYHEPFDLMEHGSVGDI